MKKVPLDKIRNVALLGHQDTGKTSFLESVLFETKQVGRLAHVADGNSTLDFIPEEIERRISMKSKLAHADWNDCRLNFIDTPGYDDFIAERRAAVTVVESVLLLVKSDAGLESGTERAWRLLERLGKPRLIVINKMDREHANFGRCVEILQKLSSKVVPIQIPIGSGANFKGFVDVVEGKAHLFGSATASDVPADLQAAVSAAREALMNAAAETDDALVEKFLDTGELSEDEFRNGLAAGVARGTLHPVLCANGLDSRGVAPLLDALARLAPSPASAGEVRGTKPGNSTPDVRRANPAEAACALAFGAVSENNVGDYTFVRVFSGTLTPGMDVENATRGVSERIGNLFLLNGKTRSDIESLSAGEIGAAVKLKNTHVGDTLCDRQKPIVVPFFDVPAPLTFTAIRAKTKGDEDKLSNGLQRLHEEDIGFRFDVDAETHQTVLKTQGDAHQAMVLHKLKRKFGVEVETEPPRTPYRETIKGKADERYRHKKQTGGRGQFGEVHLVVEPKPRGQGFEFVDAVVGGVIPTKFIPAVEKGVRETLPTGVIAGFPVVDVKVTVDDGKFHAVDSSEAAFKMAASHAFKDAFPKARPILLEPIYKITVRAPEEYMGDIMGDLSSRRGRIQGMEAEAGEQVVRAEAPLAQLYDYSSVLRSLTQGRGRHTREFSHYEEVPHEIAGSIIAGHVTQAQAES